MLIRTSLQLWMSRSSWIYIQLKNSFKWMVFALEKVSVHNLNIGTNICGGVCSFFNSLVVLSKIKKKTRKCFSKLLTSIGLCRPAMIILFRRVFITNYYYVSFRSIHCKGSYLFLQCLYHSVLCRLNCCDELYPRIQVAVVEKPCMSQVTTMSSRGQEKAVIC